MASFSSLSIKDVLQLTLKGDAWRGTEVLVNLTVLCFWTVPEFFPKTNSCRKTSEKSRSSPWNLYFFPCFVWVFFWVGEGKFIPSYAVEPWNHRWSSGGIEPLPGGHGFLCKFQSIPVLWGWVGNFRKRGKRGKGISGCKWESYIKLRWWDIFKQNMFFKQNMWSFRTSFQLLRLVVY